MSLAFRPSAAALSRLITRLTRGLFICRSSDTSCTSGSGTIAASSFAAQSYRLFVSALWTVRL